MGTTYLFKTTRTLPGMTVQLRHRGLWLSKGDTSKIMGMVTRAKGMISMTIAALSSGLTTEERGLAERYFLTGPGGPTKDEQRIIMSKLELTYGGLSSDVSFKLGVHGDSAYGYVSVHGASPGTPGAFTDSAGHSISFQGHTVHLSKKRILKDAEIGVITVIHECTHRFANTDDHDSVGYRKNDDSGWEQPDPEDAIRVLTKDMALNNADSYAWFAYQVGRKRGW